MNEQDFLSSTDLASLVNYLVGKVRKKDSGEELPRLERKLRLWACAVARLKWGEMTDPRSRAAVETSERFADGEATLEELQLAGREARGVTGDVMEPGPIRAYQSCDPDPWFHVVNLWTYTTPGERIALLREIVGNPFHPFRLLPYFREGDWVEAVPPNVLVCGSGRYPGVVVVSTNPLALVSEEGDMLWTATVTPYSVRRIGSARHPEKAFERWEREKSKYSPLKTPQVSQQDYLTPSVLHMARGIYEERDWEALPLLADLLEEAGCDCQELLHHFRGEEKCLCALSEGMRPCSQCGGRGVRYYYANIQPCPDCGTEEASSICFECKEGWVPLKSSHVRGCWGLDTLLGLS